MSSTTELESDVMVEPVTTGEIIAPQGQTWEGIGLLPSLENRGRIFPK